MELKKEIEILLDELKTKGVDRRTIEADLGYSENYIDQTLSKGGNNRFLKLLRDYRNRTANRILQNTTSGNSHSGQRQLNEGGQGDVLNEYLGLLKKTIQDKERVLEQKEADLVALRSAVNDIKIVDRKVENLSVTVHDLQGKVEDAESNIEVLREWLIDQFSEMNKVSPQYIASSMGRKQAALKKKAGKKGIPHG